MTPSLHEVIFRIMSHPGRVLAPIGIAKWPAFVLDTCQVLGGDFSKAVPAASAVEFVLAAADVVDDLVDGEWMDIGIDKARATNAVLTLASLAQSSLIDLYRHLSAPDIGLINELLATGLLMASDGEDLDLLFERDPWVSEEMSHEMTVRKSGSLVAMACQVGAAVATNDREVLRAIGAFGSHVGTVAQLLNDISGVKPDNAPRGSDLRRQKKTLPIAYALRCALDSDISTTLNWDALTTGRPEDEEALAMTIDHLGGLHYAWIVADTHRREALAILRDLANATGRHEVRSLQRLIPRIRARMQSNVLPPEE